MRHRVREAKERERERRRGCGSERAQEPRAHRDLPARPLHSSWSDRLALLALAAPLFGAHTFLPPAHAPTAREEAAVEERSNAAERDAAYEKPRQQLDKDPARRAVARERVAVAHVEPAEEGGGGGGPAYHYLLLY